MKYFAIIFLLSFFVTSVCCFAQNKEQSIQQIRKGFRAINSDSTLRSVSLDAEEFLDGTPDGGGSLTGFYKHGQLVKIEEWIGLSYGNKIREFYLKGGHLFFIYEKLESFIQKDGELNIEKPNTSFEARYYISQNKIIEKKINGELPFGDKAPGDLKEFNATVVQYRKQLASKK